MTSTAPAKKDLGIVGALRNSVRKFFEQRSLTRVSTGSAQDIGARVYQEDAFGFSDLKNAAFCSHGGALAIAADGVGGLAFGSEVSHLAVLRFVSAYHQKKAEESICEALHRSLQSANAAAYEFARSHGSGVEVGTTLGAAVVHNAMIYHISAGDTRIYRVSKNETLLLSTDHNFGVILDEMAERHEVSADEAAQDPQRRHLTSFLGAKNIVAIDYGEESHELAPGESVIICTDGLYSAISSIEMRRYSGSQAQALCEKLVRLAVAKGIPEQDNITAVALSRPSLIASFL